MDAIILFSHGSVLCGSGEALLEHAKRIRAHSKIRIVEVGYLNYSSPPFLEAVRSCVEQRASRILILPYFLVPGKFVTQDLPKAIEGARSLYLAVQFVVAEAIGYDDALADAILDSAVRALPEEHWRDDLRLASAQCSTEAPLSTLRYHRLPQSKSDAFVFCYIMSESQTPDLRSRALLVVAHGSPRSEANADLYRLVELCRERELFDVVHEAFLECNEPSIPEGIDMCAACKVEQIVVVPYFLHTGKHVARDIPDILEDGRRRHPQIDFLLGEFIGRSSKITDILEKRLNDALTAKNESN